MEIYVAGAGAGKTTSIASRIIEWREKLEQHRMIFCITFTNNAAACIENKLLEHYDIIPDNIIVSTIHSFLYREFIRPYYYLLYGKHYRQISTTELPSIVKYRNGKLKRLEERDILHQTVIPERAKWVICKKSNDNKNIKTRRTAIHKKFSEYCGAIFIDEIQDIDTDIQMIIEQLHSIDIPLILMGDPKQDIKGHQCFRSLISTYKDFVNYINKCYRCPQKHLDISNILVSDEEKQYSDKTGGCITLYFESDCNCRDLIDSGAFDLVYISKKQDGFNTHESKKRELLPSNLLEEIENYLKTKYPREREFIIKNASHYLAEQLIKYYQELGDKAKAIKNVFGQLKSKQDYGIIFNAIPDNHTENISDDIVVSSIDAVKGQEGQNCLFILTTDVASYLFGDKTDNTATKNRLYVALTRSLDRLSIYVTSKVEAKYKKENITSFFKKLLQ